MDMLQYSIIVFISLMFSVAATACSPVPNGGTPLEQDVKETNDGIMIPRPVEARRLEGYVDISQPLYLEIDAHDDVAESITKYLRSSSLTIVGPALSDMPLSLTISEDEKLPVSEEGYHLMIGNDGISIEARGRAGLFYGIQTVLQLKNIYGNSIPAWEITDWPRFSYRGMHLDVVRHFFSKEFVKKQIRMMASLKLNRMHLHLTDDSGWRIQIPKYPNLTDFGAWRKGDTWNEWRNGDCKIVGQGATGAYGGYFSTEDLKEIVAYAAERNITVIPEIEMPGHCNALVASYPELACNPESAANLGPGQLVSEICIGKESTIQFLKNVLTEVMNIFPSEYIHLGGDEYWTGHWKKCPDCQALMAKMGFNDFNQLHGYLFRTMEEFLARHGRRLIGWDEMLQGGISPDATLMSWQDEKAGQAAALAGHNVIMAPGEYCYFDGCQDSPEKEFASPDSPPSLWNFLTLQRVYSYDPAPVSMSGREKVLGCQACVWTEWMSNEKRVEYMVYPRLFALAEVAWSNLNEHRDYAEFHQRALRVCDWARKEGYATFDLSTEIGERPSSLGIVEHLGYGCTVKYNNPWLDDFPCDGASSLSDGVHGKWTYRAKWQGFKNMDVVIDLGEMKAVKEIRADFMQYADDGVNLPGKIIISCSVDGISYTPLQTIENPYDSYKYLYRTFGWKGSERKVRYIRYQALPPVQGGFVFCDEVEIW